MVLLSPFGNSTDSMATFDDLGTQLRLEPAPPSLAAGELPSFPEPHSVDDFLFEVRNYPRIAFTGYLLRLYSLTKALSLRSTPHPQTTRPLPKGRHF